MRPVLKEWALLASALCLAGSVVVFALGWWRLAGALVIACLFLSLLRATVRGKHDLVSKSGVTGKLSKQDIAAVRAYRKKNPGASLLDAVKAVMKDR